MKGATVATFAIVAILAVSLLSGFYSAPVYAAHDTNVTIAPENANCGELNQTYTVTVENLVGSADSIREVRIYQDFDLDGNKDAGIVELECGAAPSGWTLTDRLVLFNYCQYETPFAGADMIDPTESEQFTFKATLDDESLEGCGNAFRIGTIDDTTPVGQVVFKFPFVNVDCVPPVIDKFVGEPKISGGIGFDWWVTHSTVFTAEATENDRCDLGLDYCNITYTVDGGSEILEEHAEFDPVTRRWEYNWTFDEDSVHFIEITCYDVAGNMAVHTQTDRVDDTPPVTTKMISEPKKVIPGDDPGEFIEWVDTVTEITLTSVDPDPTGFSCNVGVDKVWYMNVIDLTEESCWDPADACEPITHLWAPKAPKPASPYVHGDAECIDEYQELCGDEFGYYTEDWYNCVEYNAHDQCGVDPLWKLYNGTPINKPEESCHILQYFGVDHLGNKEDFNVNCFFVDKTPPEIHKENDEGTIDECGEEAFMNPGNPEGCFHWINTDMPVTFTCDDSWNGEAPHPSGDEEVCFRVSYDYTEIESGVYDWGYITQSYCDSPGFGDENDWCCVPATEQTSFEFYFQEDSMHNLEYYCQDAVEKKSEPHVQYYKVDSTPPYLVDKWVDGPQWGDCDFPQLPGDICHIDGVSYIDIEVLDGGDICAVDNLECRWKYRVDEGEGYGGWSEWFYKFPIWFPEESKHELHIQCEDSLGNVMNDYEIFYVDKTPPETTLTYHGDQYPDPIVPGQFPHWIDLSTLLNLTATDDVGPHDSGVDSTYYRVTLLDHNRYCWTPKSGCSVAEGEGPWQLYTGEFTIPEESCHLVEYWSVDNVDKEEDTKRDCVFVDDTDPTVGKEVGEPKVEGEGEVDWYITQDTPIKLYCDDLGDHPVDHVSLWYRYRFNESCDDLENSPWSDWEEPLDILGELSGLNGNGQHELEQVLYFEEDSCHELEYYCVDILGNEGDHKFEIDIVDTQPPVINKTIVGPKLECPEGWDNDVQSQNGNGGPHDCWFIDGVTEIHIDATDPEPHPVNEVECRWGYYWLGEWYGWYEEDSLPFVIEDWDESTHELHVVCEDALGNEVRDIELFHVDKTPPSIEKQFEGPQYPNPISDFDEPHWINSDTEVYIFVDDVGPHKSGIDEVKYRISLVDDEYCEYDHVQADTVECLNGECENYECEDAEGQGDWTVVDPEDYEEFMFNIPEESCHLIEVYAVDNVEKDRTHKQCVYVDNTSPTPHKEVGLPHTKLQNEDYNWTYYPEVNGNCWVGNESIDCWKVTTMTPISMACEDPEPHPVDHSTVCFNVDFDGEDMTDVYCDEMGGNMEDDGFCCVEAENEEVELYFGEESEHNLKFYCVDALGNTNKELLDDEKFKVEGSKFTIELNKKWNLISVPFVLQDNVMSEIFDPLNDSVISVWSYDAATQTWHVYTPDGVANDDLFTMVPGDGYWVLTREEAELVIGGSLFSPGKTPPSKTVVPGWNLIGYYGNLDDVPDGDPIFEYDGPDGDGATAWCALGSLVDTTLGRYKWSSLWTYWEPYNTDGDSGTSLWIPMDQFDNMDPGAGYWMEIGEDELYAVSTTCPFIF